MSENFNDLEGRMSRLSDYELVQMITTDSDKFNEREIIFAKEELRDRGFKLEQHGSDLRILPPDGTESTSHKTVIARGRVSLVIRDVVMVWFFTAVGGFAVGFASRALQLSPPQGMLILAASNFLLGTVAFTIVGCLAPPGRWRHLGFVALGAWFTSLINLLLIDISIPQWIGGAIFIAIIMGMGGAISYIFKRETKPST